MSTDVTDDYYTDVIGVETALQAVQHTQYQMTCLQDSLQVFSALEQFTESLQAKGQVDDTLVAVKTSLQSAAGLGPETVSLQGFVETLRAAWTALQKMMDRVAESLRTLWDKIFGSLPTMRERLKKQADAISTREKEKTTNKKNKLSVTGYNALGGGGRLDSQTVINGLKAMHAALSTAYGLRTDVMAVYQSMASHFTDHTIAKRTPEQLAQITSETTEALSKKFISYKAFNDMDKITLPGDKRVAVVPNEMPRVIKVGEDHDDRIEVNAWSLMECQKVNDEAIKVVDIMLANKNFKDDLEKARKTAVSATDKMVRSVNRAGEVGGTGGNLSAKSVDKRMRVFSRFNTGVFDKLNTFGYNSARTAYNVVNLMVANKVAV